MSSITVTSGDISLYHDQSEDGILSSQSIKTSALPHQSCPITAVTSGVVPKKKGVLTQVHTSKACSNFLALLRNATQRESLFDYAESKMYLRNIEAIKYV